MWSNTGLAGAEVEWTLTDSTESTVACSACDDHADYSHTQQSDGDRLRLVGLDPWLAKMAKVLSDTTPVVTGQAGGLRGKSTANTQGDPPFAMHRMLPTTSSCEKNVNSWRIQLTRWCFLLSFLSRDSPN